MIVFDFTNIAHLLTKLQNKFEELLQSEEPLSFYQKNQLDFLKQCRLLNIDVNSPEAENLKLSSFNANNNISNAAFTNSNYEDEVTHCILLLE